MHYAVRMMFAIAGAEEALSVTAWLGSVSETLEVRITAWP
jgi:hypothetical protein